MDISSKGLFLLFSFCHSMSTGYPSPECSIHKNFTNMDTSTDSLVTWLLSGFSQWEASQAIWSCIKGGVSVLILWTPFWSYCWGLASSLSQWPLFLSGGLFHRATFSRFWWSLILLWFLGSRIETPSVVNPKHLCYPL